MKYETLAKINKLLQKRTLTKQEAFWLLDQREKAIQERLKLEENFPKAIGNMVLDVPNRIYAPPPLKIVIYNTRQGKAVETEVYSHQQLETLQQTLQYAMNIRQLSIIKDEIDIHVDKNFQSEWLQTRREKK